MVGVSQVAAKQVLKILMKLGQSFRLFIHFSLSIYIRRDKDCCELKEGEKAIMNLGQ